MDTRIETIGRLVSLVKNRIGDRQPVLGIVLGSGLGSLANSIEDPVVIPYRELPEFPVSTAVGHKGNFIVGQLGGKTVIAMQGRIHYYEGYGMDQVVLPIRVMIGVGIRTLIVSNAAGGTNLAYHVGDLMIIRDHINLLPNPLIGPNFDEYGPRFPDMTRPYDPALIRLAVQVGDKLGIKLHRGVYVGGTGPSYETPAEYKYFRTIGGDAVGMSTVPEVIVARHCGIRCFGVSIITDLGVGEKIEKVTHEDVQKAANAAQPRMAAIMEEMIRRS